MLGNDTRRDILQMLSERPCYVSQLSQELKIGQKAVIEHLELMRQVGILDTKLKKVEKGRPRKYYGITRELVLEIRIGHDSFNILKITPRIDKSTLDKLPRLKDITQRIENASKLGGWAREEELNRIMEELNAERDVLTEGKKVVEFLLNQIKQETKREVLDIF